MQAEYARIRRQVSFEQVVELLKLVQDHPELYRASLRPSLVLAQDGFWDKCAEMLNLIKGGAFKDAYGWSQYWRYFKYRIKQRTVEITSKAAHSRVPEDDYIPLVLVDKVIFSLLQEMADEEYGDNDIRPNPKDKNAGKKKAVKKGSKASTAENNAETSSRVSARKRRYSVTDVDRVERAKLTPLDMRLRYLGHTSYDSTSDTGAPSYRKRRQAFANASNAIERYFKSKSPKKSKEPAKRSRTVRRLCSCFDDLDENSNSSSVECLSLIKDSMVPVAAPIRHRRHTFTNMHVATEQYRQLELTVQQTQDAIESPEHDAEITLKKQKNLNLIYDSLLRVAIISIRMVAIMNTAQEIISNNPALQHTVGAWPCIF